MRFAGIIAEYDPFHNGHAWQLAQARALGARQVAVAMSCSLTQRGAVPPPARGRPVQAALRCGADFIFALPAPCACARGGGLARAGVRLLAAAGCDALVFGAETPDTALLMDAARVLASEEYRAALKAQLAAGARSFAAARQAAVETLRPGSALAALLDQPNNNLAVEYCKAILELDVPLTPIPPAPAGCQPRRSPQRQRAVCQRQCPAGALDSAGRGSPAALRPGSGLPAVSGSCRRGQFHGFFPPPGGASWPCSAPAAPVRRHSPMSGVFPRGWNIGWKKAVRASTTLDELLNTLTTIRYPRARMRRLAMDAALGYTEESFPALPPYLHLLGARRELLGQLKQAALPASHSLMRLQEENAACARMVQAQLTASDFAAFCRAKPRPMGGALRQKIIFLTI